MNISPRSKLLAVLSAVTMSFTSSLFGQGIHYADWQALHTMHDASQSTPMAGVTFSNSNPRAHGVISDGTTTSNISVHGCLVHNNVGSTHKAVLNGTSNIFSTSAHSPSVALTDHLVTDIGNAGTTDLVFDFGGATLTNVVLHLSDAFRTSGSNSGAYKVANYQFISDDIDSIVVNTPNTGAGSHKWITQNVDAQTDTLRFGSNSSTEGTVVLMGQIKGFTLRSSVENYTRFQFGTEVVYVPEPSSVALLGLGSIALVLRRRR